MRVMAVDRTAQQLRVQRGENSSARRAKLVNSGRADRREIRRVREQDHQFAPVIDSDRILHCVVQGAKIGGGFVIRGRPAGSRLPGMRRSWHPLGVPCCDCRRDRRSKNILRNLKFELTGSIICEKPIY